jgi:hypothetical protein
MFLIMYVSVSLSTGRSNNSVIFCMQVSMFDVFPGLVFFAPIAI